MVEAATEFRKNSFTDEDSAQLAKVATLYQNVADEAISASDSASVIIALMKAFKVEAKDATSIIDAINETANNFAVSSSDIATALPKVSATLAQSGNTMSESIGLLTAATELMPHQASRVARGLRTITLNLQGLNDEGEKDFQLVSKLNEQFGKLGISLMDSNGQIRSSYDILSDLSNIWGTLDKNTQSYIGELVGGKNQIDVFNSLLSNFNSATKANEVAMKSAGSAARENASYMESLAAKTSAVKAVFQDLSNNLLSSDLVGIFLDLGKAILEIVNTPIGRIILIGTTLATIGTSVAALAKYIPIITAIKGLFTAGATGLVAFNAPLAITLALVTALIAFAPKIKEIYESIVDPVGHFTEELTDNNEQLKTNKERLEEINNMSWNEKTQEILNEKDALEKQNEELEKRNQLLAGSEGKIVKGAEKTASGDFEITTGKKYYTPNIMQTYQGRTTSMQEFNTYEEALDALIKKYGKVKVEQLNLADGIQSSVKTFKQAGTSLENNLTKQLENYTTELKKNATLSDDTNVLYQTNKDAIDSLIQSYQAIIDNGGELTTTQQNLYNAYQDFNRATEKATTLASVMDTGLASNAQEAEVLLQKYPKLAEGVKSYDGELIALIANQQIFNNQNLDVSQKIVALQQLANQAGYTASLIAGVMSREALANWVDMEMNAGKTQDQALQSYFKHVQGKYFSADALNKQFTGVSSSPGGKIKTPSTATKEVDTWKQAFDDWYDWKQHQLAMGQETEKHYIASLKLMNDKYFKGKKQYQEEYWKYTEEVYKWEQKQQEILAEEQKKRQEEYIENLKIAANYMIDNIDKEIDAAEKRKDVISDSYDEQIEKLQNANEELENQLELEEALKQLEAAKKKQLFIYSGGKFRYVQDTEAISSAQANVDAITRRRRLEQQIADLEKAKNEELAIIDEQIKGWEEYKEEWNEVANSYEKSQNELIASQVLGIELENDNWKKRLDNAREFVSQYQQLMNQLNQSVENIQQPNISTGGGQFAGNVDEMNKILAGGGSVGDEGLHIDSDKFYGVDKDDIDKTPSGAGTGKGPSASDIAHNVPGWDLVGFANGTKSTPNGMYEVGENGAELMIGGGNAVIKNKLYENLTAWGQFTPTHLFDVAKLSVANATKGVVQQFTGNIILPSVANYQQFAQEFKQRAIQTGTGR